MAWLEKILPLRRRKIFEPGLFRKISLIAFFAWVGLGSDGLSSSCYGPEEGFLALGEYRFLAFPLIGLVILTIYILSTSYSHIIELFPTGGGGYLVATKLLGSFAGLLAGCSLIIDYVLTISISISSGVDALFSFLPQGLLPYKLITALFIATLLMLINLVGVRESVTLLMPIFITFITTHLIAICYLGLLSAEEIPKLASDAYLQGGALVAKLGMLPLCFILLKAYSIGAGTFTGIEAVSNSMQILREPRVKTAKKTMLYMGLSLGFISAGIIFGYLAMGISPREGKTLNAVLFEKILGGWQMYGLPLGYWFVILMLVSEGALLFVAAQTGFVGGPRILGIMALDGWVPRWFAHLSNRFVVQNGVLFMGILSIVFILLTNGSVKLLVVLYALSVFITFILSLLGMALHWLGVRKKEKRWLWRFLINGLGVVLCALIIATICIFRFDEGAWSTILVVGLLMVICIGIKRHYLHVKRLLKQLDLQLKGLPPKRAGVNPPPADHKAPTAVFLVSGFSGLGIHSFLSIPRLFSTHFRNYVFVSVGIVDFGRFKGREELDNLRKSVEHDLKQYVEYANRMGLYAEGRYGIATDHIEELTKLCLDVTKDFPKSVFFGGKLMFPEENILTRLLHSHASYEIQRRLHFAGYPMVILPIRVIEREE